MKFLHKIVIQLALSLIAVLYFGAANSKAETKYFIDTFNEDSLSTSNWKVAGHGTFVLSVKDSLLTVTYNRTDSSWKWNDEFFLQGISVNAKANPNISLKLKSTLAFTLNVKPLDANGDNDFLAASVPGDNLWHTYNWSLSGSLNDSITQVYFYFDGGDTLIKEHGIVNIDSFELGVPYVYTNMLSSVSVSANSLANYIEEGSGEGQFPAGSIVKLQSFVHISDSLLKNALNFTQGHIDTATNALFDSITNVEKSVNISERPLIDSVATFQTVNLYKNLKYIASKHHYLFGQQDATAYGLRGPDGKQWIDPGTGDTSDVKSVTGSNPALLSQNAYNIAGVGFSDLEPFRNRQQVCYAHGGVNSVCWHTRDPKYNAFNESDLTVKYNVVDSILPGGADNTWYKNTLYHLALYFKSVRGSHGEAIPIIWRQFHEQNGNWFWWGTGNCSEAQFNQLWIYTLSYLRDTCDVHNLIVAIAPGGGSSYTLMFPGDKYFDIWGLDDYFSQGTAQERSAFTAELNEVVGYADADNKVAALTEFGDMSTTLFNPNYTLNIPSFWTNMVLYAIHADTTASRIAYLATWQNAVSNQYYAPFPGMPDSSKIIPNFLAFYDDTTTIFLNDMLPIYNTLLTGAVQKPSQGCWFHSFDLSSYPGTFDYWTPNKINYSMVDNLPDTTVNFNFAPTFVASPGSVVKLNNVPQISGTGTKSDFANDLQYVVLAQNKKDSAIYNIKTATVSEPAVNNKIIVSNVAIYPNPASDYFIIQSGSPIPQVDILNTSGIKIFTLTNYVSGQSISTNNLSSGAYIITITLSDNSRITKLLVIQNR